MHSNMLGNSQPVIKILKRPTNLVRTNGNGINSCNITPPPVVKSLQQRELEYAEARSRIFGTPDSEDKLSSEKEEYSDVPRRIMKSKRENVIRQPRGPDGTAGFHVHRTNTASNQETGDEPNGLSDSKQPL